MASDYDKAVALRSYLTRNYTAEQIAVIADAAFAAMQDGRTTNVVIDGSSPGTQSEPVVLLQACESVLVILAPLALPRRLPLSSRALTAPSRREGRLITVHWLRKSKVRNTTQRNYRHQCHDHESGRSTMARTEHKSRWIYFPNPIPPATSTITLAPAPPEIALVSNNVATRIIDGIKMVGAPRPSLSPTTKNGISSPSKFMNDAGAEFNFRRLGAYLSAQLMLTGNRLLDGDILGLMETQSGIAMHVL